MHHLLSITKNCHSNNQLGKKNSVAHKNKVLLLPQFMIVLAGGWKQVHSLHSGIRLQKLPSSGILIAIFVVEEKHGGTMWGFLLKLLLGTVHYFSSHFIIQTNHMDSLDVSRSKNYSLSTRKGLRKQGQWLFWQLQIPIYLHFCKDKINC